MKKTVIFTTLATVAMMSHAAGSATGVVNVSATVLQTCSLGSGTVAFGDLSLMADGLFNTTDSTTVSNSIQVACTNGTTGTVAVTGSANYSGGWNMKSGTKTLPYQLFTDAGMTSAVTPGSTAFVLANGGESTFKLWSKILASDAKLAFAGNYNDVVNLTVTY